MFEKHNLPFLTLLVFLTCCFLFLNYLFGFQRTEVFFIEEKIWGEKCTLIASNWSGGRIVEYELQVEDCSGGIGWYRCNIIGIAYEIEIENRVRNIGVGSGCLKL